MAAPSPFEAGLRAAIDGNLCLLKEIASEVDLRRVKSLKGRNALHLAAAEGHLDVCRFLVDESGFDANSTSAEGETPIFLAAAASGDAHVSVLSYLLDRGGDPAMPDARGVTPLHNAAEHAHCEAVRLLLSRGVPVDPSHHHWTPLHLAIMREHNQVVKILLEHGADLNRLVNHMITPLAIACCVNSLECVKLLVESGANVNYKGPRTKPALMEAVEAGFTDIVKFLLGAGADPNIHDADGKFPITLAAACGHRELVELLFPLTKPIPYLPNWSVDGIITTMKYKHFDFQGAVPVEKQIASLKSQGKEAFTKGDFVTANYFYDSATEIDPHDATLYANRSLCWLRLREGGLALREARQCKTMRPHWSKAWYREGAALSFLKDHKGAVDAFVEAQKLDPASAEIKEALREATEVMNNLEYHSCNPCAFK